MSKRINIVIIVVLGVLIIMNLSFFTVSETEQAVVTELGKPIRTISEAGLHIKIPFIQQIQYFDKRLLDYDAAPTEILARDKKTLVVDNYCKWKIVNPLKFLKTVRNKAGAQSRIDDIVYSELRVALGLHDLHEIIATNRSSIMETVTKNSNKKAQDYGIEIIDVRIKRADLPPENEKHVYERMRAERQRKAKEYRSEGREEALKIKADADKQKEIILAEAYKKEQEIKGIGDAESTKIYAEAYEKDPDFYQFLRTLDAYGKVFSFKDRLILSPDSDFLHYLKRVERKR